MCPKKQSADAYEQRGRSILGKWVPRDLNERQMENRKVTCEMLLQRCERNSFLYRNATGNEKWIYFENPKWKKLWLSPGEAGSLTPRPNRFCKTMFCVWWEQSGIVYYELLKPSETSL
ncbi:mariner Mos1 transposase [Trichonephila clavipes]|nr:mariner Mos1 transposase [Trichonephila clavipes]